MGFAAMLHVLAVVIWVGGMFFAYMALRPAAAELLEPPQRLTLWVGVFKRFFPWVWGSIAVILATGLWRISIVFGGFAGVAPYIHVMFGLGVAMMLIFMHVYFAPFNRLKKAVAAADWPAGGAQLAMIRKLIGINLMIGLLTIVVATAGRTLLV